MVRTIDTDDVLVVVCHAGLDTDVVAGQDWTLTLCVVCVIKAGH